MTNVRKDKPTYEVVQALISYDPETGVFTRLWRDDMHPNWNAVYAGKRADMLRPPRGYFNVKINKVLYRAHRVAWLLTYGAWPPDDLDVDHIDGDKGNNRIANLRLATRAENCWNSKSRKGASSSAKGVSKASKNRWSAAICTNGVKVQLGSFGTEEEAAEAYKLAASKMHGEFARFE